MLNEKVSIVIPVYNAEKKLSRCLDSIIKQTYHNLEIILVDDGSCDRSVQICQKYAKQDTRIVVQKSVHGGASAARNIGLKMASGMYLMFIDSDDYIEKRAIENMLEEIRVTGADLCIAGMIYFKEKSDSAIEVVPEKFHGLLDEFLETIYPQLLNNSIAYSQCAKLYKKRIIDENKLKFKDQCAICEDALFVTDYLKQCNIVATFDKADYIYCLDEVNSLSKRHTYNEYKANTELYFDICDMINKTGCDNSMLREIDDIFYLRYLNFIFRVFLGDGELRQQYTELSEICNDVCFMKIIKRSQKSNFKYEIIKTLIKKHHVMALFILCKLRFGLKVKTRKLK